MPSNIRTRARTRPAGLDLVRVIAYYLLCCIGAYLATRSVEAESLWIMGGGVVAVVVGMGGLLRLLVRDRLNSGRSQS